MGGITNIEKRARKNHAILEAMGGEPVWDQKKGIEQLNSILNWYSQNRDGDDGQKYFIKYFERLGKPENELNAISKLPSWHISTYGWLARMFLISEDVLPEYSTRLENKYNHLLSLVAPEEKKTIEAPKKEVPTIQDRLQEQLREYLAESEGWIDEFSLHGFSSKIVPFNWFKENSIKPIQIKSIADHYRHHNLTELRAAFDGTDPQLVEGYSHLTKSELKKTIAFIELIVADAEKWYDISRQISANTRKPRQIKKKPAIKQIARLKYLKESGEFKSIDPTSIVGAEQLWVFNTKTRQLGAYICDNQHGFSVKGCTILNFNVVESVGKKLRKPEEMIPKVLAAGKVALRKIIPGIKAKEKSLTGRINKDTILLKVM